MCEAFDDHKGCVSIAEGLMINFCFANGIVVNAEEEEKKLTSR